MSESASPRSRLSIFLTTVAVLAGAYGAFAAASAWLRRRQRAQSEESVSATLNCDVDSLLNDNGEEQAPVSLQTNGIRRATSKARATQSQSALSSERSDCVASSHCRRVVSWHDLIVNASSPHRAVEGGAQTFFTDRQADMLQVVALATPSVASSLVEMPVESTMEGRCSLATTTTKCTETLALLPPKLRQRLQSRAHLQFASDRAIVKLAELIKDGAARLHLLADFDYTLTRFRMPDGRQCWTTYKILDESPLLPEQYRREANALRQHYADKEICPERTVADKCALTAEWYSLSHQLLIDKTELSESDVRDSVEQAHLAQFRDGFVDFLRLRESASIPMLIISAGIEQVLFALVERELDKVEAPTSLVKNEEIRILANELVFDKGRASGFRRAPMHGFNKHEMVSQFVEESGVKSEARHNVLLLGDSVTDVDMSSGFGVEDSRVLKVGFLSAMIPERLNDFLDAYDVVLKDDQSLDVVLWIVEAIAFGDVRSSDMENHPYSTITDDFLDSSMDVSVANLIELCN